MRQSETSREVFWSKIRELPLRAAKIAEPQSCAQNQPPHHIAKA
jgi:hypothetical protein